MLYKRFTPEGWIDEKALLNEQEINNCLNNDIILQGIVEKCDENYNLHINLGNNIQGIIPRMEVEGINVGIDGLPKTNLCTGKVNKFVQFKIKEVKDNNLVVLSRKDVQKEAIEWVKNDLKVGSLVTRNSKKNRKLWCFYRNWRRSCWISSYRRLINSKNKNTI